MAREFSADAIRLSLDDVLPEDGELELAGLGTASARFRIVRNGLIIVSGACGPSVKKSSKLGDLVVTKDGGSLVLHTNGEFRAEVTLKRA